MGWFDRNKRRASRVTAQPRGTAHTFVEATGGGWDESPDVIRSDGGLHADYVDTRLQLAQLQARTDNVPIGQQFTFVLGDIPQGISDPFGIITGIIMQSSKYGLRCDSVFNEKAAFVRLR